MLSRTSLYSVVFFFPTQMAAAVAEDNQTMLFDFSKPYAVKAWQIVNDGVMGGVSQRNVRIVEKNLEFSSTLSLENNGGFSSVRSKAAKMDLSKYDGLVFKVRGDGRDYYLNVHVPSYPPPYYYGYPYGYPYYYPRPVYVAPQPVYVTPPPGTPVYQQPAPAPQQSY